MFIVVARDSRRGLELIKDQVSVDIGHKIQASESDLMARGIAINLLQMAKRVGPQCEAAEHEDLAGEKNFTLDGVVVDD